MLTELESLFDRDLAAVIRELNAYPDEASLWRVQGDIVNPSGTLALHLIGNLSQYIGDDLGGVPYVRDRPAEFARRDVPRAELVAELERVATLVHDTLGRLDPARLDGRAARTLPGFPADMTVGYFLIHLHGHLNWHLGQMNYHRRIVAAR